MREVIRIGITKEEKKERKVQYTFYLDEKHGWTESGRQPETKVAPETIYYLGKCNTNGDMFMDIDPDGNICIFKGHLNSGKY